MGTSPARGPVGVRPSSATPRTGHRWWQAPRAPGAGAPAAPGSAVAFAALMAFIIVSLISPQTIVPALEPFRLARSEEHTSELQSQSNLVCRLLLEKKHCGTITQPLPIYRSDSNVTV